MISIANFLPGLRDNSTAELVADEEKKVNPFPHGPQRFKAATAGQWRRHQARSAASQRRKANQRFRREWMRNERAFNTLQQQWTVVTAEAGRFPAPMVDNVRRHLEEVYGSVEQAGAYLVNLSVERAA